MIRALLIVLLLTSCGHPAPRWTVRDLAIAIEREEKAQKDFTHDNTSPIARMAGSVVPPPRVSGGPSCNHGGGVSSRTAPNRQPDQ